MSNQLENKIQPTVSPKDVYWLAEPKSSEQVITKLSNGDLEAIVGGGPPAGFAVGLAQGGRHPKLVHGAMVVGSTVTGVVKKVGRKFFRHS